MFKLQLYTTPLVTMPIYVTTCWLDKIFIMIKQSAITVVFLCTWFYQYKLTLKTINML